MQTLISIIFGMLILGVIVAFHEFGHFLVAKKNGIGVVEFSIGMGPRLWTKVYHGTRYSLKAVPFGGACQMRGDDFLTGGEEEDAGKEEEEETLEETGLTGVPFNQKNVFVRIAVIFAGPFFNFILAFLMAMIVLGSAGIDLPKIAGTLPGFSAEQQGMAAGDRIKKLNNTRIYTTRDISLFMTDYQQAQSAGTQDSEGKPIEVVLERGGETVSLTLVPRYDEQYGKYMLGIQWNSERTRQSVGTTAFYSLHEVWYWIKLTVKALGGFFNGQTKVNDLSGPVGVVEVVNDTVKETSKDGAYYVFLNLLNLCVLLSANVGVMNLLPLPALDGGRLIFLFIEAIFRKPVDRKVEGYVHAAGIMLLLLLMVFVLFNDVRKLFVP